jgi:hypothetical protein
MRPSFRHIDLAIYGVIQREGDCMQKEGESLKREGDRFKKEGDRFKKEGDRFKKEGNQPVICQWQLGRSLCNAPKTLSSSPL